MTATTSSSPWSREASPSVTLPPPPPPPQPPPGPPQHLQPQSRQARGRSWAWTTLALLIVIAVSAGVSAAITYITLNSTRPSSTSAPSSVAAPTSPTAGPRFSPAETAAAKDHVCHILDISVRGQDAHYQIAV